jgi:TP901 family phage tail tape measure protein
MASLAELMVKVGADISEFTRSMQEVDRSLQSTGKGMMDVGKSMSNAGQKMATTVTAPLLAMGTAALVTGAKFDAQMSKVSAVSGATGKDFDKLRQQAKDLGSTTMWSASESAQGMEFLARAGWKVDEIMSAMPNVLNLATAGAIDLGTASDIASNIISGFGDTAENSQRYIDVMAKTTASANTDINQLGDAMKYVAPVAATFGWSVEETAAAIGKMSDAGIQGSQAGTALRGGLLRLASPSKEAREMMDGLNMAMFDANGTMKSMPEVIGELAKATNGMTDKQKAHTLSTIFGQEAVSGFMALMDVGSETLGEYTGELENADGTAQNMAKTMGDNLAGSFKNLLSALEGLAISFSDVMTPAVRKATDFLTGLTRKFDEMSPSTKTIIVVVGLLVAAIAPLLIVIGLVAQGVGAVMIAFGSISAPVLAIIGVVALLVYIFKDELIALFKEAMSWVQPIIDAFKYLRGGFDDSIFDAKKYGAGVEDVIGSKAFKVVQVLQNLKTRFMEIWNAIKEAVLPIVQTVVDIVKAIFSDLNAWWEENGAEMLAKIQSIWEKVKGIVVPLLQDVVAFIQEKLQVIKQFWDENGSQILEAVGNVWNGILSVIEFIMPLVEWIVKTVWNSIKGVINGVLNFIMGLVKVFAGLFTGDFKKMWEGVKQMFFGAVEAIWNYLNLMFIGRIFKGIGAFIKMTASAIKGFGTKIVGFFKGMWDNAWNTVDEFCSAAVELFKLFIARGKSNFEAFKGVISSIWTSIKTGVVNTVTGLKDKAIGIFNGLKSTVETIFNTVKGLITNPIETAKNTVLGIIEAIKGAFSAMKITIPKPKLPKVSVAMKKGVMGIPYPDFDISWNAKGNIFNGASVLGGGQGVGEAGAEAVLPIQHKRYMKPFASAVAANMDNMIGNNDKEPQVIENHVHTTITLDGEVVGRKVEKYVSRSQYDRQKRTNRGGGRR